MWSQNMVLWCFMSTSILGSGNSNHRPPKLHIWSRSTDCGVCLSWLPSCVLAKVSKVRFRGWVDSFIWPTSPTASCFPNRKVPGPKDFKSRVWLLVTGVGMLWHLGLMTRKFTGPGAVNLRWSSHVDEGSYHIPVWGVRTQLQIRRKPHNFWRCHLAKWGIPTIGFHSKDDLAMNHARLWLSWDGCQVLIPEIAGLAFPRGWMENVALNNS